MITNVKQQFEKLFGAGAEAGAAPRIYAAPGRSNLIGEHTDYNMGFVLPGAVDKAIYVAIRPAEGPVSRVYSVDYQSDITLDLLAPTPPQEQWAKYIYGVAQEMAGQCFTDAPLAGQWYPEKDFHTLYIAEVVKMLVKEQENYSSAD